MKLDAGEIKRRTDAAMALLSESSTTLEKVRSAAGLLKGINKRLDSLAATCETVCASLELASQGAYIELGAMNLPEETDEQKKRKKLLLLFIRSWEDLKSEVSRVQSELAQGHSVQDSSFWKNVLVGAAGPLAVITLVAVGIGVMIQTSVDIVIENRGCGTLTASESGVSIPGLVLPAGSIESGESEVATIPPLPLTADGTVSGVLTLSSLSFSFDFNFGSQVDDITFDGESLLGNKTELDLGGAQSHTLSLYCDG